MKMFRVYDFGDIVFVRCLLDFEEHIFYRTFHSMTFSQL